MNVESIKRKVPAQEGPAKIATLTPDSEDGGSASGAFALLCHPSVLHLVVFRGFHGHLFLAFYAVGSNQFITSPNINV